MRTYGLYIRACPGVDNPTDLKVGIFALDVVRTRLATYQQAAGPAYTEKFLQVWIGDEKHVREAEKQTKRNFKDHIPSAEAGLSEWFSNITMQELLDFIQELQDEYFIKLTPAAENLLPLTMNNCEELQEWWEEQESNT